ncbi:uncharacterized protein TRUGW13939_11243 [Talaromyces rugulosus]|uniref:Uncharacterized protein n=1 Tax=Talaromyces rugulosus TaxID=121627 RepID=A0A7H8RC77_TALRU|nr:uncharacterized protein TRUGW13939_11243 [Talaromyces rugulosus]QKX64070.1 hypothetical protein TRUGW13939_11243 [Talaromyces rugulosus]
MSGSNPFRRSKILAASESLPSIPDSRDAPNLNNLGVFDPEPKSYSKSVRIATPPVPSPPQPAAESSRSYFPAAPTTTRTLHSPPPLGAGDSDDSSDESASDPFNPHASAVDTSRNNNSNNINDEPRYQQRTTSQNDTSVLNNPGSRLSVATEPQGRGVEEASSMESSKKSSNNATLDVDAFTRLLLTGNADQLSDPKKTATTRIDTASDLSTPPSQIDNDNNNVETEKHPAASASQRTYSDNTSNNLGTAVQSLKAEPDDSIQRTASVKRPKPPPPKTRHGKPIKAEEYQQSRKSSAESYPSGESSQKPIYPTTSISPPSNYREEMAAALEANPSSNSSDSGITDDVSSLHRTSSQSKRPPTPPLARRHSQIKPNKTPQPPRPRDNLHRISLPPRGLGLQIPGPPSPGFKTPPRPPSRRHGEPLAGSHADSLPQPKSSLSQDHPVPSPTFAVVEDPSSTESSSPPSRQPSIKRTPSGSATHMAPPPPPPPRRARTSSKSSLNNPAAALQTKTADDQAESEPQPSSHAKDILADLSRLQQEVDSLRGHYENRKVSQ